MIDILPKDFFVRPPTMDDLLVVHKLIEECDIAEYGEPEITLDDLRILWQSPTFNMASDAWMVIAPGDKVDSQNLTGATRLYERAGIACRYRTEHASCPGINRKSSRSFSG